MKNTSLSNKQELAKDILRTLPVGSHIRNVIVKEVDSPWDERITRIKPKSLVTDIKLTLWKKDLFLYGRIYRLFLYVSDALDPNFKYDPDHTPHGLAEPTVRETYNHIWGIYVDSRVEKVGIENFYDRTLRRNLFIDTQKSLSWTVSNLIFDKLWLKGAFTHPELIDYANNIVKYFEHDDSIQLDAFEIEIGKSLTKHSAIRNVDKISSNTLRGIAYRIVDFIASQCKGTLVESSYYGIYFMYDQEIFVEMATTKPDALLITVFDFQSNLHHTYTVKEDSHEVDNIQVAIREIYDRIASHSYLKTIKNPYGGPVEK